MRVRGLDLSLGERRRSRHLIRPLGLAAALATAAGLLWWQAGPLAAFLTGLPGQWEAALGNKLLAHYSEKLEARDAELFALRNELAALSQLGQENQALRSLVESGQAGETRWQVGRVTALFEDGFSLYCPGGAVGQDVLTPDGHFAGVVSSVESQTVRVIQAGTGAGAVACTANGVSGYLSREKGQLVLAGLLRHSSLTEGVPVTTATGRWVGQLTQAPVEDETGLRASAPLTDVAGRASLYFVAVG